MTFLNRRSPLDSREIEWKYEIGRQNLYQQLHGMIAQPTPSSSTPLPLTNSGQDVVLLREKLDEALRRIHSLEQRSAENAGLREALHDAMTRIHLLETQSGSGPQRPALFAPDAPVMGFAKALCGEIFPGPFTIEVACAPDDPSAQWYVFLVRCAADIQESIDREVKFGRRLIEAFPEEAGDIRLLVLSP